MRVFSSADCRELDRRATVERGIPVESLMESAGRAAFHSVSGELPSSSRLAVFCGKGNNGGDGFVFARAAAEAGHAVLALVTAPKEGLTDLASLQCQRAVQAGVTVTFCDSPDWPARIAEATDAELAVDALLGTGFSGRVDGPVLESVGVLNQSRCPVLALDVPSGIVADTGAGEPGRYVVADRTVTFAVPKPFLFQGEGVQASGKWEVADIGFPADLLASGGAALLHDRAAARFARRPRDSQKGLNGHVLVVAGSRTMPGAATLAARGALRSGAGLVTVASVPWVLSAVAAQVPECLSLPLVDDDGWMGAGSAEAILGDAAKFDSAVFGPGMGQRPSTREFLEGVFPHWECPSVVDADALNLVAAGLRLPSGPVVATPHPGEASRLLGLSVEQVQADRFASVRRLGESLRKTVHLKGAYSLTYPFRGTVAVNSTGNSGMATGGMGDVLSGAVAGLLAQGWPPEDAAADGALLHGLAGDLASRELGEIGYSASDLAHFLPRARSILTK